MMLEEQTCTKFKNKYLVSAKQKIFFALRVQFLGILSYLFECYGCNLIITNFACINYIAKPLINLILSK